MYAMYIAGGVYNEYGASRLQWSRINTYEPEYDNTHPPLTPDPYIVHVFVTSHTGWRPAAVFLADYFEAQAQAIEVIYMRYVFYTSPCAASPVYMHTISSYHG